MAKIKFDFDSIKTNKVDVLEITGIKGFPQGTEVYILKKDFGRIIRELTERMGAGDIIQIRQLNVNKNIWKELPERMPDPEPAVEPDNGKPEDFPVDADPSKESNKGVK